MRIDVWLVEHGLVSSRSRAKELIEKGRVIVVSGADRKIATKASLQIGPNEALEIDTGGGLADFASRGGIKLQGALEKTRLDVSTFRVLDVGISTGGFTDCLLRAGARSVVGIDVGHGQLSQKLAADARVTLIEGVNARSLTGVPLIENNGGARFDLAVIDVSFISLTLVLPEVIQYLKDSASVLALVKPQFEVGRAGLGKNGIVTDPARFIEVEEKIRAHCATCGLTVEDYFASPIEGSDGNREFFVYAYPAQLALGGGSFHRDAGSNPGGM